VRRRTTGYHQGSGLTSTILGAHDVHVWHRTTDSADALDAYETDLSDLSPDERARCARFAFARDRRDFAAAHALLRTQLSRYADIRPTAWTFDARPGGKPFIVSSGESALAFNLSHTHGLVACAIARCGEVGIDVESVDRALDGRKIAARYFSKVECEWLDACDARERAVRFIELWTLKEAYIKAIGLGLTHPLNAFSFTFADERRILFNPPPDIEASAWTFALFAPSAQYRMAVAFKTAPRRGSIVARSADGAVTDAIRA
jgi:4'-phosphopantetheinyl transferase